MTQTAAPPELAAGSVVGGSYRVVRKIGSGGMSVVYEGENLRLPELRVALKVLKPGYASHDEFCRRFRREAAIGARVRHPNVAAVIDWNTLPDGSPLLVLEYLEGESLHERMARGPIPDELMRSILRQVAAGLDAAHAKGVIHRDLKPRNIFLVPGGADRVDGILAKVIDFGVSKIVDTDTLESTSSRALGTPRYMSPEQVCGESALIGPASDQFALAALTYQLLTGRPAFDGDDLESVLYRIINEDPLPVRSIVPDIPERVELALRRALHKRPRERFPTASMFVRAAFADELGSGNGPIDLPAIRNTGEVSTARRRRVSLVLAAAGVGALAGALAIGADAIYRSGHTLVKDASSTQTQIPAPRASTDPPWFLQTAPLAPAALMQSETAAPLPPAAPKPSLTRHEPAHSALSTPMAIPSEPPTAAAREKLAQAEAFARHGEFAESIRVARQSLAIEDSGRAHLQVFLGFCSLADLGNARAVFFSIRPEDQWEARRHCRERGLEF